MASEAVWFAMVRTPTEPHGEPSLYHDVIPESVQRNLVYHQRLDTLPHWDKLEALSLAELAQLYHEGRLTGEAPQYVEFVGQAYDEYLLQFFEYNHLPEEMRKVSKVFQAMAHWVVDNLPNNLQRSTCLNRLLEAKDSAVRARISR